MTQVWTAQDLAATFGSFAGEAAYQVAELSADWFASRRDAAAMVERYTSAAVWTFIQGSAGFHALETPDPIASMKAYQADRLKRFVGVAPNQTDASVWRRLQEDAETFARVMMAPEAQSSAKPLDHIADGWFRERAGRPLSETLPAPSAARLAAVTGELYSGVSQVVARAEAG